ncbi:hypothetical protein HG535_0A02970 [Zygotorulaspora mrakii]|uniref:Dolichyl-diphosphooligosaccharide--protein glycosyltransferase subunit OST2 n=1 Tax=Zygotorulaspora mrakii TaxID=42260 RepID=A0A7H9AVH3_ZYGMR|nr:uncharacterized protein HG535_0A02970 [Zygotorulaspora mrakii]QLG70358.1 hypothetical protein HG535_0A02970 [Zygotorulaspora mrakii]
MTTSKDNIDLALISQKHLYKDFKLAYQYYYRLRSVIMAVKNKKASVPASPAGVATTPKGKPLTTVAVGKDFSDAYSLAMKSYWLQISKDNRLKLIDMFCVFLVAIAAVQCLFMVVVRDTFPFNAFLSGFIACVGQFVLLISLRLQYVDTFKGISKNRAFGEFILASLVLHFICLHFIN